MISVKKVAKVNPKITVHDIGPQNATVSPPTVMSGSKLLKREKKSKFSPIAKGTNPRTVVTAVSSTGRRRVLPARTRQLISSSIVRKAFSDRNNFV